MKRWLLLILACSTLSCATFETGSAAALGRADQEKMREMFYRKYTPYLRKYVAVYVAYVACSFDFIDEAQLNDLADSVIEQSVKDVDKALQGSASRLIRERADARAYLANFIALGMIDAQSTLLSESHGNDDSRPEPCDEQRHSIQAIYTELPELASGILSGR